MFKHLSTCTIKVVQMLVSVEKPPKVLAQILIKIVMNDPYYKGIDGCTIGWLTQAMEPTMGQNIFYNSSGQTPKLLCMTLRTRAFRVARGQKVGKLCKTCILFFLNLTQLQLL